MNDHQTSKQAKQLSYEEMFNSLRFQLRRHYYGSTIERNLRFVD